MTRLFSERRVDTGRDGGGRRWWRRLHRRQARVGVLVHQARHVPRLWTFQTQPSHNTVSQLSPQPQVQQNTNGNRQLASQQPRRYGGICIHITKGRPLRRKAGARRERRGERRPADGPPTESAVRDFLASESGVPPAGPDSEGRFLCCDAGGVDETPFDPEEVSAPDDRLCQSRGGEGGRSVAGERPALSSRRSGQTESAADEAGIADTDLQIHMTSCCLSRQVTTKKYHITFQMSQINETYSLYDHDILSAHPAIYHHYFAYSLISYTSTPKRACTSHADGETAEARRSHIISKQQEVRKNHQYLQYLWYGRHCNYRACVAVRLYPSKRRSRTEQGCVSV